MTILVEIEYEEHLHTAARDQISFEYMSIITPNVLLLRLEMGFNLHFCSSGLLWVIRIECHVINFKEINEYSHSSFDSCLSLANIVSSHRSLNGITHTL
jgi:hypothetical protein